MLEATIALDFTVVRIAIGALIVRCFQNPVEVNGILAEHERTVDRGVDDVRRRR